MWCKLCAWTTSIFIFHPVLLLLLRSHLQQVFMSLFATRVKKSLRNRGRVMCQISFFFMSAALSFFFCMGMQLCFLPGYHSLANFVRDHMQYYVFIMLCYTQRNKHVIITSKRRFDVMIPCLLRCVCRVLHAPLLLYVQHLVFWWLDRVVMESDFIVAADNLATRHGIRALGSSCCQWAGTDNIDCDAVHASFLSIRMNL